MQQVFQDLRNGEFCLMDMPLPKIRENQILVSSICSLISPGTEGMLTNFGKSNYIQKVMQKPEKMKDVIDKIASDGLIETYDAVKNKLETPLPLGYSNVGYILEVGKNVKGFKIGDRVASNGPHAEIFVVNQNLCALVPEEVSSEEGAFTVLASIGLQGVRLSLPTYGETFLVSGLGLIGLLTAQILISQGCRVLGVDLDKTKCLIAESFGVETFNISENNDQVNWILNKTNNIGVDGAIITAATSSSLPINLAAKSCRKKGRIILVGSTSIDLKREYFYEKEISFQVSCSYGPGRYDKHYEENSIDYPIGYVRWTEKRNFEAILYALSKSNLKTKNLISHRFDFEKIKDAYKLLLSKEMSLGILIQYQNKKLETSNNIKIKKFYSENQSKYELKNEPFVGFIGSGNYASKVLIPSFAKAGCNFHSLIALNGNVSSYLGKKFSFPIVGTDSEIIFNDESCNSVVISTRHDTHCELFLKALHHKKNIFLEKPLCINFEQLKLIEKKYEEFISKNSNYPVIMIGFNRRFSPLIKDIKHYICNSNAPKSFIYTINAGKIDIDHWIQDPCIGGGRLIGEACHFLDLLRYLADSSIKNVEVVFTQGINPTPDNFILQIKFEDGSIGSINYFSNGNKAFPKERLEVFCDGNIHRLDNFKTLKSWGSNRYNDKNFYRQDKGQYFCAKEYIKAIQDGLESPIKFNEILEVQFWLLKALEKIKSL